MLGISEPMVLVLAALVCSGVPLLAAIDAARKTENSFELAGQKKGTWVIVLIACAVFWGIGLVGALYYFVSIRPKVAAFERDPNRPTLDPKRD